MKKTHLIITLLLGLISIVLGILLGITQVQLHKTLSYCNNLESEVALLQNRVGFFPMTQAEEDLFYQNLETIQAIYPEGDIAHNAAQIIHDYHRIGTIPMGYITFAESVENSNGVSTSSGDTCQLHFITSDNINYYMVFSDESVVGFWKVTESGEQLIFGYEQ